MMDNVLTTVRDLLAAACAARAKKFYVGDIGMPLKNACPAILVRPKTTEMKRPSTTSDQYVFTLSILVVTDIAKSFNEAGLQNSIVASQQALRKIMEEADTDGAPKVDTVLGCLMRQANIRNAAYSYNLYPRIDYNPPAPQEFFYIAAEMTCSFLTDMVKRKA